MVYEWSVNMKPSAQAVGDLCEQLKNTVGLSPKTLLDASRAEDSLLHNEFEWNNDIAAEKYRLEQSRHIIANLKVVPEKTDEPTRAFVVCTHKYGESSGYEHIADIMSDEEKRQQLLESAKTEMRWFKGKYHTLVELAKVMDAIDEVI